MNSRQHWPVNRICLSPHLLSAHGQSGHEPGSAFLKIQKEYYYYYYYFTANIKMDLREIGWEGMDWIDLAQDRDQWRAVVNTVMNLRVP
jgi:hypothetical protein